MKIYAITYVATDLPPAPSEILKIIRCNYQTDYSCMRCTCKKHNVKCSVACGNCRGSGCTNSEVLENDDDNAEDAPSVICITIIFTLNL